jgi:hypothetical protein
VLRFEVVEVYKGNKYNDTAIAVIDFDGIDGHQSRYAPLHISGFY